MFLHSYVHEFTWIWLCSHQKSKSILRLGLMNAKSGTFPLCLIKLKSFPTLYINCDIILKPRERSKKISFNHLKEGFALIILITWWQINFLQQLLRTQSQCTMYDFHDSTDIFVNPSFLQFCSQKAPWISSKTRYFGAKSCLWPSWIQN